MTVLTGIDAGWQCVKYYVQKSATAMVHSNRWVKVLMRVMTVVIILIAAGILKGANLEEGITGHVPTSIKSNWMRRIENYTGTEHWTEASQGTWQTGMFNEEQRIPGTPAYSSYCYGVDLTDPKCLLAFTDTACTRTVTGDATIEVP